MRLDVSLTHKRYPNDNHYLCSLPGISTHPFADFRSVQPVTAGESEYEDTELFLSPTYVYSRSSIRFDIEFFVEYQESVMK